MLTDKTDCSFHFANDQITPDQGVSPCFAKAPQGAGPSLLLLARSYLTACGVSAQSLTL